MGDTISFKRRSSGDHELLVTSDYLFRINEEACRYLGASVYELAQSDPAKAYQYLRRAIATTALEQSSDISYDGMIVADISLQDIDDARSVAEDTILNFMPTEYEGPFDVTVTVLPDELDQSDIEKITANAFSLRVQPDSLAA